MVVATLGWASVRVSLAAAEPVAAAYAEKFGARPEILHLQTGDGASLHAP